MNIVEGTTDMDRKETARETITKTPFFSIVLLIGAFGFSVTGALDGGAQIFGPINVGFLILCMFGSLGVMMTSDRA